jgi:hypothetical protein
MSERLQAIDVPTAIGVEATRKECRARAAELDAADKGTPLCTPAEDVRWRTRQLFAEQRRRLRDSAQVRAAIPAGKREVADLKRGVLI